MVWVVYEGVIPGIYDSWYVRCHTYMVYLSDPDFLRADAKLQVSRISHNVHQAFPSRHTAERAYFLAYAMGCVRSLPVINNGRLPPAAPTPAAVMTAFDTVSDDFLGEEWHVVFKGRQPGYYPAWFV